MNNDLKILLDQIISFVGDDVIELPIDPRGDSQLRSDANKLIASLKIKLGHRSESDYFSSSEIRFSRILEATLEFMPNRGTLLDVGNAPGYLAEALFDAGFKVKGINLSSEWESTYPSRDYLDRFDVSAFDVESGALPFPSFSFDGIVFTEVLEHIAIRNPNEILEDFLRVLKPGGILLFSTPNVANLSNILALLKGINIFWSPDIFYGSVDRHNREWTPREVQSLFARSGFEQLQFFGINDHANWRTGTQDEIYQYLEGNRLQSGLLRNTTIGVFRKPR